MKKKLKKLKRRLLGDVVAARKVVFTYCEE